MDWTTRSEEPRGCIINPFQHQFANHFDERRMRARGRRPDHRHGQFFRNVLRFVIEIVNNLHVIRDKTDWRNDNVVDPLIVKVT
jgi:hypothetical protein